MTVWLYDDQRTAVAKIKTAEDNSDHLIYSINRLLCK